MAVNLQKVVNDLHGADEQTKLVALTLLIKLPDEQLLSDRDVFRQLSVLANEGTRKSQGKLADLFVEFHDRLETLRHKNEGQVMGDGPAVDISGLGRGDPAVQISTLEQIQVEGFGQAAGEIRALLEVGAVDRVTAAAIVTLASVGDPAQDLPRFRTHLGHPAGIVRASAVKAFSRVADDGEVVLTLGPALGDRHPHVRMNAIRALGRVGREAVLERVQALVEQDSPEERSKAMPLLSYLRGPVILEIVRKMATDPSDSIRLDVVNILRAHGGSQVMGTLEWLAQDKHPTVKTYAARSILLLRAGRGQRPGLDISQLDSIPDEPGLMDLPALPGLPPQQQVQALMRLKRQAPPGAYDQILPLLEAEDLKPEVAASLLSALSVLGGREDISRLRPFLAHMDGRVRANAVEAIDVMGGRKDILTWLTPMLADPIPRVKKNVLIALGRFGEAVFLGHLQRMIHSNHVPVRISGVYALAHYPGAAAKQLALQVLQDKESEVRINFAEALAGKSEVWTKEVLQQMSASDMDFRVREAAKTSFEAPAQGAQAERVGQPGADSVDPDAPVAEMGAGGVGAAPEAPVAPEAAEAGRTGAAPPQIEPPPAAAPPPPEPASPPSAPEASGGAEEGGEPVYTMVDGLPMCPMPDEPSPSVKVSRSVQEADGLQDPASDVGDAAQAFRPSVDIPRDLVLGAARQASEGEKATEPPPEAGGQEDEGPTPPTEEDSVAEGEALVMESMTANAQDGQEAGESSSDLLGRTFMNFAALISPGKMATMKEVQALEKERSEVLERFGRNLYEQIANGTIKNSGFDRTLYVLKKYLHSMKQGKKGAGDSQEGGWLGKIFGASEGDGKIEEPPQLRAQFRNLAKDALSLKQKGELELAEFENYVKDVGSIDEKISALQARSE